MKTMINFTTSTDDTDRYQDREDLRRFCRQYGCDGLELMPLEEDTRHLISPDLIIGIHANCLSDWMDRDVDQLLAHYRRDLNYARSVHAEYVVFHVTQVSFEEALTCKTIHTDYEVIDAAARLINLLLDGQDYDFWFLMENLWWPGLNFQDPSAAKYLLERVHYEKKGFMLDTGHFMNTNTRLRTSGDAITYLHSMLDRHENLIPMIKGLHLNLSLSGAYAENYKKNPDSPASDPESLFRQGFEHIFRIDQHLPFDDPGVPDLIHRISPLYVTLEYITRNRREHEHYLQRGVSALHKSSGQLLINFPADI